MSAVREVAASNPAAAASELCERVIRQALAERGRATVFLSGGSSPKPVYEALGQADLDWSNVTVGLVDERVDAAGSNVDFLKSTLLRGAASDAGLLEARAPAAAQDLAVSQRLPADLIVMGMGSDGHTASWFPGAVNLDDAMDPDTPHSVVDLDARGCPGAGDFPARTTLTLPAVMSARQIVLYLPTPEKVAVFDAAADQGLPVAALRAADDRLTIIKGAP